MVGSIPSPLRGRYLRNGPNPVGPVDQAKHHWFLGNGMVHGIRLRDGRAEWYRNRYVRTPDVTAVLGGDPCPSQWPAGHPAFSANTSVVAHAGRTFAIVEAGSPPVELGYELDTVQVSSFDGTLPYAFTAHPKRDPRTGELHAVVYYWGWGDQVQYLVVGTDGRVRHTVDIPLPGAPMVHDMSLTERYAVVYDLPCTFDLEAASAGSPLPYRWNDAYVPRLGLLPRDGSVFALIHRAAVSTAALFGKQNIRFDPRKLNWIGSLEQTNRGCFVTNASPAKSAAELFTKEILVGGAGAGTSCDTFEPSLPRHETRADATRSDARRLTRNCIRRGSHGAPLSGKYSACVVLPSRPPSSCSWPSRVATTIF